ncbi:unnamed protein product [Lymnaea stagnalis]|uniref:Ankyrin repeat domain-containing protein 39 n=1 Tax=Lymnaea stagnalis TaxID=6523 RepID=A0AAV2HF48_LYMST
MAQHGSVHGCSTHNEHEECHHHSLNPSVHQTLDELAFEKGIWASALAGDNADVELKLMRGRGSDVNNVDKSGYTALHYACRNGHIKVCRTLLSYKADVNVATIASKATPLHRAAYMGHSQIVSLLMTHGADPKAIDCDGMTALHKAAENGHVDVIEILVKAEPTILFMEDNRGRKPTDIAKTDEALTMLKL